MKKAIELAEIEQGEKSSVLNEIPCLTEVGTTISTLFIIIQDGQPKEEIITIFILISFLECYK